MTVERPRSAITLFAGLFGSGKTEAAISYALSLVGCETPRPSGGELGPILIDLDIVTPFFRSREAAEDLRRRGVDVVAPAAAAQHLDLPAITPQILGAIEQTDRPAVLDVGGDRQGARALGQFSAAISRRGYVMHLVVNPFRPFTDSAEGLQRSVAEIEASSRLRVTDLVSNPNLMGETTLEQILAGHRQIESFAERIGLPISLVCVDRRWAERRDGPNFNRGETQ